MKTPFTRFVLGTLVCTSSALAIDDFNLQMAKMAHEETSWRYDIYTVASSAELWKSECPWLQKPAVTFRFNATHQEHWWKPFDTDMSGPMADVSFQTWGGINVGVGYSHSSVDSDKPVRLGITDIFHIEGDVDSVGAYVSKRWDSGFKVAATWAYSSADFTIRSQVLGNESDFEFDTVGASGSLGFARSFGEKKFLRNVFVDTSANFLYQSDEEAWYFLWMAKAGHNVCPRLAIYGIFNLFHELNDKPQFMYQFAGYHPFNDETWGEAGGGFQAQLPWGISLTAEATTPVLDEEFGGDVAENAFQIRAALNWTF